MATTTAQRVKNYLRKHPDRRWIRAHCNARTREQLKRARQRSGQSFRELIEESVDLLCERRGILVPIADSQPSDLRAEQQPLNSQENSGSSAPLAAHARPKPPPQRPPRPPAPPPPEPPPAAAKGKLVVKLRPETIDWAAAAKLSDRVAGAAQAMLDGADALVIAAQLDRHERSALLAALEPLEADHPNELAFLAKLRSYIEPQKALRAVSREIAQPVKAEPEKPTVAQPDNAAARAEAEARARFHAKLRALDRRDDDE